MKFAFQSIIILCTLTACGPFARDDSKQSRRHNREQGDPSSPTDFAELQSASPTKVSNLLAAFGMTDGLSGFVAFYSEHRYFAGLVQELSSQSARIMGTIGTYDDSDGSHIRIVSRRTTCQEAVREARARPDNKAQISGRVDGDSLTVTAGSLSAVLPRLQVPASSSSDGLTVQWGCFSKTGEFVREAWSEIL